jgi:hypothetical protein
LGIFVLNFRYSVFAVCCFFLNPEKEEDLCEFLPGCAHDTEDGEGEIPHGEQASKLVGRPATTIL